MQEAGYYTAIVGKWGVGGSSSPWDGAPTKRGFDYFYGYFRHIWGHHHYPVPNAGATGATVYENLTAIPTGLEHAYTADLWTAKAKQIIADRTQNHPTQPFFLYLAYETPHAQLQVPTQAYPANPGLNGGIQWLGTSGNMINTATGTNDSYIHPDYVSLTNNAAKRHATMVRRLDNCVGDILQTLRDLHIDDNTLVVFTSDNGPHNVAGQGGSYTQDPRFFKSYANMEGIKRDDWEAGIREPTFAWWPTHIGDNNAATPGLDSTRPSAFWDWMPTLVDAAGLTPPAWTSGVSLLPELTGTGTQQDKGYLYSEYNVASNTPTYTDFPNHGGARRNQMQYIFLKHTDGKIYKGVRYSIASAATDFKIYDVDIDPGEANDLAPSMSTLQQAMKDKVLQVRINNSSYGRPYSSANVPAVSVPSTINGLDYKAFEGTWDWVPETAYLAPAATGTAANLDLTKRTRDDDIALEFTGFIQVPAAGSYTFQMTTDSTVGTNASGGMLWLHDANHIDDDFNHSGAAKSVTLNLAAGLHPIRVLYKHVTGTHDLTLQYSGPGIALQAVPDSAFFIEGIAPPGPPEANDDEATTTGSTTGPGASVLIDVLANDTDDGSPDPITITAVGTPRAGTAVIESEKIRYTPRQGFFGTDAFTYTISDGQDSDSATVTVTVIAENDDHWYPFDESGGLVATEAGGAKPASLVNFTNNPAQWVAGKFGNALQFDGTDDFVTVDGYQGILGSADRTLSAWIKTTGTGQHPVIAWGPKATGQKWTFLVQGGNIRLEVASGYRQGATTVNNGAWRHVACTFANDGTPNAADLKLYVDGVLETSFNATRDQAINTTASLDVRIGSDVQNRDFVGTIDDARIYTRALSATEIADLAVQTTADNDSTLWFLRNLGNPSPTSADWEADPNGDGYSNYAAYALGGSPHWFDPAMLPVLDPVATGTFDYLFNRRIALGASAYMAESSIDLQPPWTPLTGATVVPHPDLDGFERVTVPLPDDGAPRRFVRLRVE